MKAKNQSNVPFSLLKTPYANEVYELMHDPIRIIRLPAGLKAGAISDVAWSGTEERNIVPCCPLYQKMMYESKSTSQTLWIALYPHHLVALVHTLTGRGTISVLKHWFIMFFFPFWFLFCATCTSASLTEASEHLTSIIMQDPGWDTLPSAGSNTRHHSEWPLYGCTFLVIQELLRWRLNTMISCVWC